MSDFKLGDYVQVDERIAEFREKYPEGSLQPVIPEFPFDIRQVGDKTFIVYSAAAYRTPDDKRPGIGCAWEQFPGATPYTRNSELMNAETSAWGRAIIAALAADAKRGIASAEEVRNRQAEQSPSETPKKAPARSGGPSRKPAGGDIPGPTDKQLGFIHSLVRDGGYSEAAFKKWLAAHDYPEQLSELPKGQASELIEKLKASVDKAKAQKKEPPVEEQLKEAGFEELGEEVPF